MRSAAVVITIFVCSFLCIITVLTVGSYSLQKDEIERALDYALVQTARSCVDEQITNPNDIAEKTKEMFASQIKGKRGTLKLFVLHADENIIDLAVSFSYKQYNGTKKEIHCRETVIKDWAEESPNNFVLRGISKKYLNEAPERGGLMSDSIWKKEGTEQKNLLQTVFSNEQNNNEWKTIQKQFIIKGK